MIALGANRKCLLPGIGTSSQRIRSARRISATVAPTGSAFGSDRPKPSDTESTPGMVGRDGSSNAPETLGNAVVGCGEGDPDGTLTSGTKGDSGRDRNSLLFHQPSAERHRVVGGSAEGKP